MEKGVRRVLWFFLFTFLWTWVAYFTIIAFHLSPYSGAGMPPLIIGGCAPTFVGLIMAMRCMGRTERKDYLLSIVDVRRISVGWWLFILFAYPLVNAVAVGVDVLLGGALPTMVTLRAVAANPISLLPLLLLSFMSGPFSEELGWRGFALRPLTQRFGFGWAAMGLGLVWAAWHLPLYMMPETWHGSVGFGLYGFVSFVALSVGLSLSMGVVFLRTRGSILSAMLLHLSSNLTSQLLQVVAPRAELLRSLLMLALGIAMAARHGRQTKGEREGRLMQKEA